MTRHNYNQRLARLRREIAHFEAQIKRYAGAKTPRGKASRTRARHCLNRRRKDLKRLQEQAHNL